VESVTLVYVIEADGVVNATPAVADEFVAVGAFHDEIDTPPAE